MRRRISVYQSTYDPLSVVMANSTDDPDNIMVEEGLRSPKLSIDRDSFTKSNKQRKDITYAKKVGKNLLERSGFSGDRLNVAAPQRFKSLRQLRHVVFKD